LDVKYDKNKLCWVASPHKGLKEGITLFNRLVEFSGNKDLRLYTFNPGYMLYEIGEYQNKYIVDMGPMPCKEVWQHVSESLCLWYPTRFEETFGNIAAEANALHVPVLTHQVAALSETVSSDKQFAPRTYTFENDYMKGDIAPLIDKAVSWMNGDRPKVWGNDQFRSSVVIREWVKLLSEKPLIW
jgi:glycosyltransferase involved in cell wall biosynthesis